MIRGLLTIFTVLLLLVTPALSTLTDNGNRTITDSETALTWQKEAGPRKIWDSATTFCGNATLGGYVDWRLPTKTELEGLIVPLNTPKISPLFQTKRNRLTYWSGTEKTDYDYIFSDRAYIVYFSNGQTSHTTKRSQYQVRCVSDSTCEGMWQAAAVTWQGECATW